MRSDGRFFYDLDGFAKLFITTHNIRRHQDIRTELLADAFRQVFNLPPFPSLKDLLELCPHLGIKIDDLPLASDDFKGLNTWDAGNGPAILLRPDLSTQHAETTLGHELREVLENALKRARPFGYSGLNTQDNKAMNPESDQFAGCLLMQGRATRERMAQLGYDLVAFASEKGRSLPSVILRCQELFSAKAEGLGPVAGVWLFDAPWEKVQSGVVDPSELTVRYRAHLRGFSIQKNGTQQVRLQRMVFPRKGSRATEFRLVVEALERRAPVVEDLPGFDIFAERDFVVAVEPHFVRDVPWRVLMTAVRTDTLPLVRTFHQRLGARPAVIGAN